MIDNFKNIEEASTWAQRDKISFDIRMLKNISKKRWVKYRDVNTLKLSKTEASDLIDELNTEWREAKKEQLSNKLNK